MAAKSILKGAAVLMAAGLVVKIFGFFYRIYLSNLIGSEGMGLFQLISPVYSLVILTLTSGISIAVSKMVSEQYARKQYKNALRISRCALLMVVSAGMAVSFVMYFKLDFITEVLLKDSRTYYSLLLLIPCIPVIAAASAIKGYFYGIQNMLPTALSQIAEQIVRVAVVMLTAEYFLKLGLEYACALAVIGMTLGEIANLAVVYFIYLSKKRKTNKLKTSKYTMRKRTIIMSILKISIPVSSNRFITSIMSAFEVVLIPRMLVKGGMNYSESIALYGRLTGMAMPLLFFPAIVTSSLATTLVPAISEAISLKQFNVANIRISKSIKLSLLLGFIFTAVFFSFSQNISNLVYKNEDVGGLLKILSVSCIFLYLQQTLLGILNGLGKQGDALKNSIIGYAIRICFVLFFIPRYGIDIYIAGIFISLVVVSIMDIISISSSTGIIIDLRKWFIKPAIICILLIFAGKTTSYLLGLIMGYTITKDIFSLIIMFIISVLLLIVSGIIDPEKIPFISGGKKCPTCVK